VARFNPIDAHTVLLFISVLSGEFAITGFRNRDLQAKLFDTAPPDDRENPPDLPSDHQIAWTPVDRQGRNIPPLLRHSPRHQSHVARHPLPQIRFPARFPEGRQCQMLKLPRSCQFLERSFT
jgi:hypothetical protein